MVTVFVVFIILNAVTTQILKIKPNILLSANHIYSYFLSDGQFLPSLNC